MSGDLRVVVAGATGKTGGPVTRALLAAEGIVVVGAAALDHVGQDLGTVLGGPACGVTIDPALTAALDRSAADVLVDFTTPAAGTAHIETALERDLDCVIGTTGIPQSALDRFGAVAAQKGRALFVIANFSIGIMLLQRLAREAVRVFPAVEIVEKHHATKLDAPSGTALRLAEALADAAGEGGKARVSIHSIRLPGLVAHHELLFGGTGETLTLTHDTLSRDAFGPGVVHAVRATRTHKGLVTDLETILRADDPAAGH